MSKDENSQLSEDDNNFKVGPLEPIKVKPKKEDIIFILVCILFLYAGSLIPAIKELITKFFK